LSHTSLDTYHAAEEHFTQELVSFTKKQFFEVRMLHVLILSAKPITWTLGPSKPH